MHVKGNDSLNVSQFPDISITPTQTLEKTFVDFVVVLKTIAPIFLA